MQYFYLIWALIFFLIWVVVFFWRKDTRKEMLVISTLFGWGGVVSERVYIADWWQPLTITGTRIGIEDFLVGFCIGGIAAVIYEDIYYRHLVINRSKTSYNHWLPFFGLPALFLGLFYFAKINSFYSTIISYILCISLMLFQRRDLVWDSLFSGLCMMAIGIGIYLLLFLVRSSYIHEFWILPPRWYTRLVLGIPIGEYFWYFFTGAFIGPLYEYMKNHKLSKVIAR